MKSPLTPKAQAALEQIEAGQGTLGITRQMIDRLFGQRYIDWDLDERPEGVPVGHRTSFTCRTIPLMVCFCAVGARRLSPAAGHPDGSPKMHSTGEDAGQPASTSWARRAASAAASTVDGRCCPAGTPPRGVTSATVVRSGAPMRCRAARAVGR